jgi:response regulator RpfG family c-di-GMP phosphodiesterase
MSGRSSSPLAIHDYLLRKILTIVVLAIACLSAATYFVVIRPAEKALANTAMMRASRQVEYSVRDLFGATQNHLASVRDWGRSGMLHINAPQDYAKLLIPVLRAQPHIAAAMFADGQGHFIQLNRPPGQSSGWMVRVADVPGQGAMQRWSYYDEDFNFIREEQIERLYDARTRPWYKDALATPLNEIHWTDPYPFFQRKDIGITATSRWTDSATGDVRVVAFDLLLADLTHFVSQLQVSQNGSAALLTTGGKLVAAPRLLNEQFEGNPDSLLFKTPSEAGAIPLAAALDAWQAHGSPDNFFGAYRVGREGWITGVRQLRFNNLMLDVATFGPERDFILITRSHAVVIGLMLTAVLALAFVVARRISNRFAKVADHLVAESERIGNLQLDKPVRLSTEIREIDKLVRAQERMRVMLQEHAREIQKTQDATIMALASLAEARDGETGNHICRTQHYVKLLAEKLQTHPRFADFLTKETIGLLFKSAPLHDIGKVGIPDAILLKPGKLTPEEFEIMKTHTTLGGDAIAKADKAMDVPSSFLRFAGEIAYSHQEKWNGTGYPKGLAGDAIPISARLMALADVYDALISRRVYKPPFSHEKAVSIIREGRGTHFDPDVTDAFLSIQESFRQIAQQFADDHDAPVEASESASGVA